MEQDLKREARSALIGAAERLGVDPFRLARFLSNGRLADILTKLRVAKVQDPDAVVNVTLTESYLEFLEQEIALRRRGSGRPRDNGAGTPLA